MRTIRKRFFRIIGLVATFAVLIFSFALLKQLKINASAADVSRNFTITEAHMYKDDAETQEIDAEHGISPGSTSYFKIKFKWKYESSTPIANGDTVTFPLANNNVSATSRTLSNPGMSPQTIMSADGHKIGEWKITSRRATITFSDAAVGRYSIDGEITTPRNLTVGGIWKEDMIIPVTVGNLTLNLLIPGSSTIAPAGDDALKSGSGRANSRAIWSFYTPGITMNELYRGEGQVALSSDANLRNIIVEDPLDENVVSASVNGIGARVTIPRNWQDGSLGGSGFGNEASILNMFTERIQQAGQSYDDFKVSLQEFEYGIYTDEATERKTVVFNFGSQPSSKTYLDALMASGNSYSTMGDKYLADTPFATSDVGATIDRITGRNNVIGGAIVYFAFSIRADYAPATIETPLTNTATFSYDNGNNEHIVVQKTARSALVVGSSVSKVKGEAKLYLRDKTTLMPISGANVRLQVKNDSDWVDIENGAKITGADGSAQVLNLDSEKTYRWVQDGYADHYLTDSFVLYSDEAMSTQISEFVMPEDNGVIAYATNEKESFTVTYQPGEHGDFSDIIYRGQYYGTTTPQPTTDQIKGITGWTFTGWSPDVANIVTGEAVYTAQWQRQTRSESVSIIWDDSNNPNNTRPDSVKVQLLQNGSNYGSEATIASSDNWTKTWSNLPVYSDDGSVQYTYTISNKSNVPGYTATVSRASNGTYVVTFKIKKATITTNHYLKGTTTKVADTETQTLDYGAQYNTSKKTLDYYNYDSVSGIPSDTVGENDVTVNYYYTHKTGTLTVHHYQTGTTTKIIPDEVTTKNYGEDYNTSYKNNLPNHTYDSASGTPAGLFTGDTTVTYYYKLKTATITTHYYIKDTTTKIAPDVVETKNYTENYETYPLASIPAQYQNYELVSDQPVDYKGTVDKATITVIYYYQKKDARLSSNIELTAPESVKNKKEAVSYKINYVANIKDYIDDINVAITMKLPYPIDEDNSELDGGIYDAQSKTITWTKNQAYNSYTDGEELTITHELSLVYDGAQAKDQLLATAEATIQLGSKSNDAADSVETAVKTPSKLIFRFVDQDGKVIQEEHEEDGFVGDESKFRPVEIPGYKLVAEENMDYLFGEEQKTITYHYVRLANPNTGNEEICPYFIIIGALASTLCCASAVLVKRKI